MAFFTIASASFTVALSSACAPSASTASMKLAMQAMIFFISSLPVSGFWSCALPCAKRKSGLRSRDHGDRVGHGRLAGTVGQAFPQLLYPPAQAQKGHQSRQSDHCAFSLFVLANAS